MPEFIGDDGYVFSHDELARHDAEVAARALRLLCICESPFCDWNCDACDVLTAESGVVVCLRAQAEQVSDTGVVTTETRAGARKRRERAARRARAEQVNGDE